jgi:hypothetical protein
MFAVFLAGILASGWLHVPVLVGASFLAGAAAAAWFTHRRGLLMVTATPPLIFLIAVLGDQVFTAPGSTLKATVESIAAGTFLTLAGAAPWLFAGVAGSVAIATLRGLPQCFRELRSVLRDHAGPRRAALRRG